MKLIETGKASAEIIKTLHRFYLESKFSSQ